MLGFALLGLLTTAGIARPEPPAARPDAVHKLTIDNAGHRTVVYTPLVPMTPTERVALAEKQDAENEAAYATDLLRLKRQLVRNERILDDARSLVQWQAYTRAPSLADPLLAASGLPPIAGVAYTGLPYYPYATSTWGWGYPTSFYRTPVVPAAALVAQNYSCGIADDGAIKVALARTIASQATPEFSTEVRYKAEAAQNRLAAATKEEKGGAIVPAAGEVTPAVRQVVAHLRNGDKVEGTLVREDPEWVTIQSGKQEVRVRLSDVSRLVINR